MPFDNKQMEIKGIYGLSWGFHQLDVAIENILGREQ